MPFENISHDAAPIDAAVVDTQYVWLTDASGKVTRALVSAFEAGIGGILAAGGTMTGALVTIEPTAVTHAINTTSDTTANLADVGAAINTTGKFLGKQVFNTTTIAPVWAGGAAAADVWVDATGATAHSPV